LTKTTKQKELARDRATVRAEVKVLTNPQSTHVQKNAAAQAISAVVLRGTGLTATAETPKMLARLVSALDSGTVGLLGIQDSIKLKCSAAEAASIPANVLKRLDKLV